MSNFRLVYFQNCSDKKQWKYSKICYCLHCNWLNFQYIFLCSIQNIQNQHNKVAFTLNRIFVNLDICQPGYLPYYLLFNFFRCNVLCINTSVKLSLVLSVVINKLTICRYLYLCCELQSLKKQRLIYMTVAACLWCSVGAFIILELWTMLYVYLFEYLSYTPVVQCFRISICVKLFELCISMVLQIIISDRIAIVLNILTNLTNYLFLCQI